MPRIMATYNKNEMLPQRKEALERWTECIKHFLINTQSLDHAVVQTEEEQQEYAGQK